MNTLPTRTIVTIVLTTVLICSFVPGLNRLGPFLLHTTAYSLDRTAHVIDRLSNYHPHHSHDHDDDADTD